MPDENKHRKLHRSLVDRILTGEGEAAAADRASAFAGTGLPPAVQPLIDKIVDGPTRVTDADVAAAEAAGYSEDQLFELVVCAAVGRSSRLYHSGLAALDAATDGRAD
ncbi:hypothetical protein ACFWQG_01765 [Rhodococcus sp. NPDC058532]|uniref:hypothetical protein n=1 Tax=Rhodococcus sp. NPDC058532 TaxID=3346540 RepID=UPI003653CCE6